MLDATSLNALGRQMRRTYELEPKGAIPDRLWQLLLDLERRMATASAGDRRKA